MWLRILPLLAVVSLLTACASGVPRTPDRQAPNLDVPGASVMLCPAELTGDPQQGKPEQMLQAHVEDAETYHACRLRHEALVKALCRQQGVTINGRDPAVVCKVK